MAKKKTSKKETAKANPVEEKRKKLTKRIFWGSWIVWALIMLPKYWPNKCAAFFEPWLNASFTCPPVSLFISLLLGSLFMAFLTWVVGWLLIWLYFYHKELTWENIKGFFKG